MRELNISDSLARTYKDIFLCGLFDVTGEREGILIIGDLHEPFTREEYLDFCVEMYNKHNLKDVIFIGDLLDNHFSSYHETDPDGHGAAEELSKAKKNIKRWYEAFPEAKVMIGNHDLLPNRKAMTAGLSKNWIRPVGEVLDVPNWEFLENYIQDDVLFCHGIGRKAKNRAVQDGISVCQGHYHSESYVHWFVGKNHKWFALQIGCGLSDKTYAAAYGRHFAKMHINVGVIKDHGNLAFLEYMNL